MSDAQSRGPLLRRPVVLGALAVLVVLFAVALWWFQPWKLVVDQSVQEAPPVAAAPPGPAPGPAPGGPGPSSATAPVEPAVLARGELISHEHETSGAVELLGLADGSRVLRLTDLNTSNGPVLRVWLSDQLVIDGSDGWYVFDDGRVVDLGDLKGNIGSANYPIPADADLSGLSSVSIWCERFGVSFGAATLIPVT